MKRIHERYELNEADIQEAIIYWLNQNVRGDEDEDADFEVTLKSEQKVWIDDGGRDSSTRTVVSAIAQRL